MEKVITCLLIDDDPDDHEIFRMAIGDTLLPVSCEFAFSWPEASNLLHSKATYLPDFIFIDWYLSGSGGAQNLEYLRLIPKLITTQIIIYSGYIHPLEVANLCDTYKCRYLEKSASLTELTSAMKSLILKTGL